MTSAPTKRGPGHRAVDARDAIAELTERAQEISQEAGSTVAIAMKDVVSAAAGIAGFAVEGDVVGQGEALRLELLPRDAADDRVEYSVLENRLRKATGW